jgi:hypothetical protein
MKMNRRQALIGIGTLAVGSGAALGSGAFTSVEANRTVDVQTEGDASAYLQLTGQGNYVADNSGSSGELTLDLGAVGGSGFNENAVTKVADIVEVKANPQDSSSTVNVGFGTGGSQAAKYTVGIASKGVVTFYISTSTGFTDSGTGSVDVVSNTGHIDAKIDTSVSPDDSQDNNNGNLDIMATTP